MAPDEQDFELVIYRVRLHSEFRIPISEFKSRAVRAPLDIDVAEGLDFTSSKARVRKHGLRLADCKFKERLDPFLFADEQEFCPVEIQHQRNFEQLSGTERDVGVRKRPVRMNDIGLKLAANFNALEEPADDIGNRQELQPGLVCHLARGAFFVGQEFPFGGSIAKTVHLDAIDFVTFEPLVRRRQNLDVEARLFEVRNGGPQPRDFGVFVKARVNRTDD